MQPNQNQPVGQANPSASLPSQTVSNQNIAATPTPSPANSGGIITGQMQVNPALVNQRSYDKKKITIIVITVLAIVILLVGFGLGIYLSLKDPYHAENNTTKKIPTNGTNDSSLTNNQATENKNPQPAQSVQSPADSERIDEINTIHARVEAYYNQTGSYPTLADLSDAAFRKASLNDLSAATLTDPAGNEIIGSSANSARYGYVAPKSSSCPSGRVSVCNIYVLTAILSNGQSYTKQSLH